jgi:histidine triad (HIT) family protein
MSANDFYCEEVLSGKTSVEKVFESTRVLAFRHTRPSYPVHIVVIPKLHVESLLALDNDTLLIEIMQAVKLVAGEVVAQNGAAKIVTNLGEYQDSKHLHWHVLHGKAFQ